MALLSKPEILVTAVTTIAVGIVIVFHYEVMHHLNQWRSKRKYGSVGKIRYQGTVLAIMFVLLFAHIGEIWLFGVAFWLLLSQSSYGTISGYSEVDLLDCVYLSAANYTTVGWGDLAATGDIRFLAGTEALVGFMMITWSASFGYLVMSRTWSENAR